MRMLAFVTVIMVGSGAMCSGFAQAVAEGAMIHANSAAATAKVGSALGDALNGVMSGNAEKIKPLSATKIEHVPYASRKVLTSSNGQQLSAPLAITSIRGGKKPCTAAQSSLQVASNSSDRSKNKANAPAPAQTTPAITSEPQDCGAATGALYPSKSVINLSFPK